MTQSSLNHQHNFYTVDVMLTLDLSEKRIIEFEQKPDFYSDLDPTSPSDEYNDDMKNAYFQTHRL